MRGKGSPQTHTRIIDQDIDLFRSEALDQIGQLMGIGEIYLFHPSLALTSGCDLFKTSGIAADQDQFPNSQKIELLDQVAPDSITGTSDENRLP
jgi:hypothetical protein